MELGSHPLAVVVGAAVACGLAGLVIGLAAGGFFAGITGWEPGAWRVPIMNSLCGALLGAVIGIGMYRVAVRDDRAHRGHAGVDADSAAKRPRPEG